MRMQQDNGRLHTLPSHGGCACHTCRFLADQQQASSHRRDTGLEPLWRAETEVNTKSARLVVIPIIKRKSVVAAEASKAHVGPACK